MSALDFVGIFKNKKEVRTPAIAGVQEMGHQSDRRRLAEEGVRNALNALAGSADRYREVGLLPRVGLFADGSHIENQQIHIIGYPNSDLRINFKLTEPIYEQVIERLKREAEKSQGGVRKAWFVYRSAGGVYENDEGIGDQFRISNALEKEKIDTYKIRISTGERGPHTVRAALGLVEVTIPGKFSSEAEIVEVLEKILHDEFGIDEGLAPPDNKAELEYKIARYKWHHKTDTVPVDIERRLIRSEILPGYFTFVECGKSKEYAAMSPCALYHKIYSIHSLPRIVKSGALLATHERFRRGCFNSGMSSHEDIDSGGADSVFARFVNERGLVNSDCSDEKLDYGKPYLLFNLDILDRTDWYAYNSDRFGTTTPSAFSGRPSPSEFFGTQSRYWRSSNELMFRLGIPIGNIKAIACLDEWQAHRIVEILRKDGVDSVNGKPVEEIIVVVQGYKDFIEISKTQEGIQKWTLAEIERRAKSEADKNK